MSRDSIRARVAAATEGPWETYIVEDGHRPRTFVAREGGVEVPPKWYVAYLPEMDPADSDADAAFIAHARQDIPALLAVADAAAALVGDIAPREPIGDCIYCSSRYLGVGRFDFTPHDETCVWWLAWKAIAALEALP